MPAEAEPGLPGTLQELACCRTVRNLEALPGRIGNVNQGMATERSGQKREEGAAPGTAGAMVRHGPVMDLKRGQSRLLTG